MMTTIWIENTSYTYEKRFCFLPHICEISNKFIWMKFAYRVEITDKICRMVKDILLSPDEDLYPNGKIVWRDSNEHLMWLLRLK